MKKERSNDRMNIPFFAIEACIDSCLEAEYKRIPSRKQKIKELIKLIDTFFGKPSENDEIGVDPYIEKKYELQKPSIHDIHKDWRRQAYETLQEQGPDLDNALNYYHTTLALWHFEIELNVPPELRSIKTPTQEVRKGKVENETVEKEQSHEDLTELKENIQSMLIQNTGDVKGINYTKLKNKTYNAIKEDVVKDPFIYGAITRNDIEREIDRQTMMLIALGLLESINGYIFNPNKIRVGEHIPTVIKKELGLYKKIYKEEPVERGIFR